MNEELEAINVVAEVATKSLVAVSDKA